MTGIITCLQQLFNENILSPSPQCRDFTSKRKENAFLNMPTPALFSGWKHQPYSNKSQAAHPIDVVRGRQPIVWIQGSAHHTRSLTTAIVPSLL